MNYCDYLFDVRSEWIDNLALVDLESGRRYTYRQLQAAVLEFAGLLEKLGCRPGQVIATHLYNGSEAVIAHFSIQYLGGVSCLLDPLLPARALPYYLADTQASGLITHLAPGSLADALPEEFRQRLLILGPLEVSNPGAQKPASTLAFPFEPDVVTAIFYTSGTTNQPKGVMLTPGNFYSHFKIFTRACYTYSPQDRLLCFVPFSHGYGSKSVFLPALSCGAAIVMLRAFQPVRVVEAIEKEAITHIFGVPSHYQQLLRREEFVLSLRKLKAAFSAAALLKLDTAQAWKERVGFYLDEGYGLIETCTGVAFRRGRLPERMGEIGSYPADLVEIEVLDEALQILPAGQLGEISVRGPSVMRGYLNKPEETARVLQENWFRTGDLGYKTADQRIVLAGRIKDVINIAGIKVAPFEVEAALNDHPQVSESAVVGMEDDMYGEVVKAFVKPRSGTRPEERELMRYLQTRLMNFQVPKSIVFVDEFPRNNMGKIDKKALRSL